MAVFQSEPTDTVSAELPGQSPGDAVGAIAADLTEARANQTQVQVGAALGNVIAGWKVALNAGRPVAEPRLHGAQLRSPARLTLHLPPGAKIETEFGRLDRDGARVAAGHYSPGDPRAALLAYAALQPGALPALGGGWFKGGLGELHPVEATRTVEGSV